MESLTLSPSLCGAAFAGVSQNDPAMMQQLNPLVDRRALVSILQTFANNILICSPIRLFPGTLIQLQHKDMFFMGETCGCAEADGAFEVMLEVQNVYASDPGTP